MFAESTVISRNIYTLYTKIDINITGKSWSTLKKNKKLLNYNFLGSFFMPWWWVSLFDGSLEYNFVDSQVHMIYKNCVS